ELTWSKGFFGPAILLFFMALCYLLITRDTPEQARIQNLHREHAEKVSNKDKAVQNFELEKLKGVLGSSSLWATASMYFFLKMTRYAFLFWLPIYMVEALGYENEMAGYMSSAYELAGFFGILLAGYVSDKFFNSRRFPVATVMLFGLAFSCLMLPLLSDISMIATLASIALIGMMTYGPDSLMSATGAIDIGGENGAATAVGVINGIGSMGQLISPFVVTFFSKTYGWDGLFYFFVGLSLISSLILLLKWRS
ncbi:MAG: MFS transporter, partial [Bacteroidota bacterium]